MTPHVRPSVGRLVGWLVGWTVDWLVGWLNGCLCGLLASQSIRKFLIGREVTLPCSYRSACLDYC